MKAFFPILWGEKETHGDSITGKALCENAHALAQKSHEHDNFFEIWRQTYWEIQVNAGLNAGKNAYSFIKNTRHF